MSEMPINFPLNHPCPKPRRDIGSSDLVILGTDTDAGKTTFALLFLTAFRDRFEYWKPVETGDSDSEKVRNLVAGAKVFPPLAGFAEPVAPALAAKRECRSMPGVAEITAALPASEKPLLIETFVFRLCVAA